MARAKAKVRVSVAKEFEGGELGDRRLNARLERIARAADANPSDTFPDMMGSGAELEGFYRFVRNEKVSFDEVLRPHVSATVRRVAEHDEVIVMHDTTEFRFLGDKRQGLGRVGTPFAPSRGCSATARRSSSLGADAVADVVVWITLRPK